MIIKILTFWHYVLVFNAICHMDEFYTSGDI